MSEIELRFGLKGHHFTIILPFPLPLPLPLPMGTGVSNRRDSLSRKEETAYLESKKKVGGGSELLGLVVNIEVEFMWGRM